MRNDIRGAHLVGSVSLENAESVFRTAATTLGGHLRRIPDGETGERKNWILFQALMLGRHPDFVAVESEADYTSLPVYTLRDGIEASAVEFPDLGYASLAKESHAIFKQLRNGGVIPEHVRFQVSLPTPVATIAAFVAPRDQAAIEPTYEAAMLRELGEILDAIPHDDLAIQWDVCIEVGMFEDFGPPSTAWFDDARAGSLDRLGRLTHHVPADVAMGFHLCYGDYGHEHFMEPKDTAVLVEMANGIFDRSRRPVSWLHLPVPRDRDDAAYFAPLRNLDLPEDTKLYLGLVHMTDGEEGTRRRIATAQQFVPEFGVATECGFGRRPAEQIAPLMRLHAQVAAAEADL